MSEQLEALRNSTVLILGIGNTLKGDDGAGPLLCRQLAGRVSAHVLDVGVTPENYLGPILAARPDALLLVDATDFGGAPGAIRLFGSRDIDSFAFSTHALSPCLFLEMLHTEIDVDIHLIGIQPSWTKLGDPVCGPVQESVQRLADLLAETFPARS